ncbi:MAG: hypothetical protein KF725_04385 [Cyclobacteriaceae bacterium]|nr:hypothetical protein [Cyclobacteriaceae bacterium]UYN85720.1 MAG: hypothetical protein KIT51_12665 [Cyclobacteriaceae bacterium]
MRKFVVLTFLFTGLAFSHSLYGQKSEGNLTAKREPSAGLALLLGPSAYYFQGSASDQFTDFSTSRISYQLNGFVGYTSGKGGNSIGVFGTLGYTNESIFNEMLVVQGLQTDELNINKFFTFYQVEAGMIIANTLRFSTGLGKHDFTTVNGDDHFRYLSTTVGLLISLGPVYWNIDANFNYGRDWPNTAMKLSTGLLVKF